MRHLLLFCAIFHLTLKQVVSGDVKRVLKGGELHLHIQKPDLIQDPDELEWTFTNNNTNKEIKIVKYSFSDKKLTKHRNYAEGRVNFSTETYSLMLNHLQKLESGLYEARVEKDNEGTSVAQYSVIVQDAVSPVHLTVGPVSSRPDSCNLTVTCRSDESSVTNNFTCDNNQTCSQEGGESSEVMTTTGHLSVYVSEGSVICNHSNQVSMKNITKEIEPLCQLPDSDHEDNGNPNRSINIIGISVGCVAGICGLAAVTAVILHRKRGKWNPTNDVPNTTYDSAQFQSSVPATTIPDSDNPVQHPEHGDTSITIYSLLQHPSGSVPTATTETSNTTPTTTNPESQYAQVQKSKMSNSHTHPSTN